MPRRPVVTGTNKRDSLREKAVAILAKTRGGPASHPIENETLGRTDHDHDHISTAQPLAEGAEQVRPLPILSRNGSVTENGDISQNHPHFSSESKSPIHHRRPEHRSGTPVPGQQQDGGTGRRPVCLTPRDTSNSDKAHSIEGSENCPIFPNAKGQDSETVPALVSAVLDRFPGGEVVAVREYGQERTFRPGPGWWTDPPLTYEEGSAATTATLPPPRKMTAAWARRLHELDFGKK
jgi:hypothetical protein